MRLTDFPSTRVNTNISGFQLNRLPIPIISLTISNTLSISELSHSVSGIFPPIRVN